MVFTESCYDASSHWSIILIWRLFWCENGISGFCKCCSLPVSRWVDRCNMNDHECSLASLRMRVCLDGKQGVNGRRHKVSSASRSDPAGTSDPEPRSLWPLPVTTTITYRGTSQITYDHSQDTKPPLAIDWLESCTFRNYGCLQHRRDDSSPTRSHRGFQRIVRQWP